MFVGSMLEKCRACFEVEHSTDIQNSLLKFIEIQDYNIKFFIVADKIRKEEYIRKLILNIYTNKIVYNLLIMINYLIGTQKLLKLLVWKVTLFMNYEIKKFYKEIRKN